MVVGGMHAFNDVELIDLSGQGRTCRKPDDFPEAAWGSVGEYFQDRPLVCGGFKGDLLSECYYYNSNGTWTQGPSMEEPRAYAAATVFNQQFWVTGGDKSTASSGDPDISNTLYVQGFSSTEVFNSTSNSFIKSVSLPVLGKRNSHNIISIDENRTMLLGGQVYVQETFIFSDSWSAGPKLSRWRRSCQAGLVTFNNGTRMIVAAGGIGEETTEFLIVDDDQWHFGPDLPYEIRLGASVQFDSIFLIVGGNNGSSLDTIWMFDTETEEWTLLNEHLTEARQWMAAFLVPDDFC